MTLTSKFKKDIGTLRAAANKEIYLDVKNPNYIRKSNVIMLEKV